MYPILIRLSDRGFLETQWETVMVSGRPPRHLYRLTPTGVKLAAELALASKPASHGRGSGLRPSIESA